MRSPPTLRIVRVSRLLKVAIVVIVIFSPLWIFSEILYTLDIPDESVTKKVEQLPFENEVFEPVRSETPEENSSLAIENDGNSEHEVVQEKTQLRRGSEVKNIETDQISEPAPTLNRGIVICLYDKIVDLGLSLIKELRCMGNDSPIQVHHCLPDELSVRSRRLLEQVDSKLEIVDSCTELMDERKIDLEMARSFQSYWIKPLALFHSSFEEVMLIDADDIFLKNPSLLWENKGYKETGTVFFYDRVITFDGYFNSIIPVSEAEASKWEHVQNGRFESRGEEVQHMENTIKKNADVHESTQTSDISQAAVVKDEKQDMRQWMDSIKENLLERRKEAMLSGHHASGRRRLSEVETSAEIEGDAVKPQAEAGTTEGNGDERSSEATRQELADLVKRNHRSRGQNRKEIESWVRKALMKKRKSRQYEFTLDNSEQIQPTLQGEVNRRWLEVFLNRFNYAKFGLEKFKPSKHLLNSMAWNGKTCHEQDSSIVVFHKLKHAKTLEILWHLITVIRFEFEFSWGDKEAFWLSCELANIPYFFSPWGVGVVSSSTSRDMEEHPDSLCGSIAQYVPVESDFEENDYASEQSQLFYLNGRAAVMPVPIGEDQLRDLEFRNFYNEMPSHATKRSTRRIAPIVPYGMECLTGFGSIKMPVEFFRLLGRRRLHYNSFSLSISYGLEIC